MELECTQYFHYNGNGWTFTLKKYAEYIYNTVRNEACDIINGHYEECNRLFNETYPGYTLKDVNDPLYNRFVADYMNTYLIEFNRTLNNAEYPKFLFKNFPFEMWCNNWNSDLTLFLRDDPSSYVEMTLKIHNMPW